MVHTIIYGTAIALMACGAIMAFVPLLPALSFMFVVALGFAIYDGFTSISGAGIVILLGITVTSIIIDHTAGLLGAKYGGAHAKSLLWGMLGAFIGIFALPAFGSFIGLFIGVLVAELYYKKHHTAALKAAGSALIGTAVGVAVNVCLAIAFLGAFIAITVS